MIRVICIRPDALQVVYRRQRESLKVLIPQRGWSRVAVNTKFKEYEGGREKLREGRARLGGCLVDSVELSLNAYEIILIRYAAVPGDDDYPSALSLLPVWRC